MEEVKRTFKPEFLNRIDDIIVFRPLTRDNLQKIVELEMNDVRKRMSEQGYFIELTPEAKEFLIDKGFDPILGARPLRRTIQRYVEDPLAEEIIAAKFKVGDTIKIVLHENHLQFEVAGEKQVMK